MRELKTPSSPSSPSPSSLGLAYPLAMTGVAQVAFPGRPTARCRARRRSSAPAHRPGLLQGTRGATSRAARRSTGYAADGHLLQQPGPEPAGPRRPAQGLRRRLSEARAAVHARPDRGRHPVRRGDDVGLGRRPRHLRGQRRASRPTASPRVRGLTARAVLALIDDHATGAVRARRREVVNVLELNLALDREASR